jgi:spermidine synthase
MSFRIPRYHIRVDDGRHFLHTTKLKFDGITSDPLDLWVKGAAPLYTKEFFQLEKDHLKPAVSQPSGYNFMRPMKTPSKA